MKPLDKSYLSLQFRNKIYSKNGAEFQSFFEDIMVKAFEDYKKIRPYGNKGDGGNDGYRKNSGIYYQVYAPDTPKVKEKKAAEKLKEDFQKLKNEWDEIAKIKEYNFVFNDKYFGSVQLLEQTISNLKNENKSIIFKLFLAKDLEDVFFRLDDSDILNLGFNIDQRQAISNAYIYLKKVKIELDREIAIFAQKILEYNKDIIFKMNDESLSLEYEILECRCLQKLESMGGAKEKYEDISKRFPNDPRAFLYLAEIYLNDGDFDKNKKFLEKAKEIDSNHWLLKLEELVRKIHLEEKIDVANINEKTFPDDPREKANFYRLYAIFLANSGDKINADSFIAKAINLNPDRLSNYIVKLSLIESRLFSNQEASLILKESPKLLEEIEKIEKQFFEYGDIGPRNKAILNIKKLKVLYSQENYLEFERISEETFKLSMSCSFNNEIEQILVAILMHVVMPENDLNQLLEYLKKSKKEISEDLSKVLICQFNLRDSLFTEGMKFFEEVNNKKYLDFINDLKSKNYQKILKFLESDNQFAISLAATLKKIPELRRKIIENLRSDKSIQKEKLLLLINFDEENFDEAFEILKQIDLTNLSYLECKPILKISQEKGAWDFEIIVLKKLLEKERNEKEKFNLKIELFNAYHNLKQFPEVIDRGEQLLKQDSIEKILDSRNKEALLINTIIACFERGKFDSSAFKKSQEILEEYQLDKPSFEFKAGLEAEVYLNNNEPQKALESVIEGVKIKKVLSHEEYAKLYFILAIKIGNLIKLKLDPLNKVTENTFVKLKNREQWYFIGNDNELDALKIPKTSDKYSLFINREIGDKVVFETKYGSENREEIIETIFSIEKYILWQTVQNFQNLSKDGLLDGVQMVEVPQKDETVDLKNLLKFLEDQDAGKKPFFELYCKNDIPLAMLAVNEGGLTSAIGRIQQENKGFINFSTGAIEELNMQKDVAKEVLNKETSFYIDGTSAFVLAESGLFKRVYNFLPNMRVPQSVINLLVDITERFRDAPGRSGYLKYARGKIAFSSVEKNTKDLIQSNFYESIKLLELKRSNIIVISPANKVNCFSEQNVHDELSDACILAQKENLPVLTEDFLYLKMNELETNKKPPDYFSSFAFLRVLYEEGKVSFDEYLDFFGYLSAYRFRFLQLNVDDIEKAVFGAEKIKIFNPENIRKFNFPLTLSKEYGVQFKKAFTVVIKFILRLLVDNAISPEIMERIFVEIIESFPTEMDKKTLGQKFLIICVDAVKQETQKVIFIPKSRLIQKKIDKLLKAIEIYNSKTQLWTPK